MNSYELICIFERERVRERKRERDTHLQRYISYLSLLNNLKRNGTPVTMRKPETQILVSKYYSQIKGT